MRFRLFTLTCTLFACASMAVDAEQSAIDKNVLKNRIDQLESQSVQRQGKDRRTLDLLNRQDDRIAGQALNALKTRSVRDRHVPALERQLLRSRRPTGSFDRR